MIMQPAWLFSRHRESAITACLVVVMALAPWFPAAARPVTPETAVSLVTNWLSSDSRPLGARLSNKVVNAQTFPASNGTPLYYAVNLRPTGFVIVSADDDVEPIVAFSSEGRYDPSPANPLGAMVANDLPARVGAARALQAHEKTPARAQAAQTKWRRLLSASARNARSFSSIASLSDPRVDPFVQSRWGQSLECGWVCYNYYTPPGPVGSDLNYPAGCLATAMAQLMRHHRYPGFGVGTGGFDISVYGVPTQRSLLGGNGSGGPYDWNSMVLDPNCETTLTQRQAIAALCHDAGVAAHMDYRSEADGGSGASLTSAYTAMLYTFYYANAKVHAALSSIALDKLYKMVNPNLHARAPVILGIRRPGGNHAVICDGYGYDAGTQYHHLNMGWTGLDDTWYNLPDVDAVTHAYDAVTGCLYNVFPYDSGEIIAGRVTDSSGAAIGGAGVTAGSFCDTTDARGLYALRGVSSNTAYTVRVQKDGFVFADRAVTTGYSQSGNVNCGNLWDVNFTGYQTMSISDAKKKADDYPVAVQGAVVSAAFGEWFYVETENRSTGILVHWPQHNAIPGRKVDVIGAIKTNESWERYIEAASADDRGQRKLNPVGMSIAAVGGSNWKGIGGYTGRQKGVTGGVGLNNVGLLVRLSGRFTYIDEHNFTLDDGSGAMVHCVTPAGVLANPTWQFVTVSGISSLEMVGDELHSKLLVRNDEDIQIVAP